MRIAEREVLQLKKDSGFEPSYLSLHRTGELREKVAGACAMLEHCNLCARYCGVDRRAGQKGYCRTGDRPVVSSFGPHFGEESPLVGRHGSGTIFLTSCNLLCVFCQNCDISHFQEGETSTPEEIAGQMLYLQKKGCHNINFVTPTHQMPFLVNAVEIAAFGGLRVPIVWNCGGYESLEALSLLEGIVDIYMPDFKFWKEDSAIRFCQAPGYPEAARSSLREMHRQVGDLLMDDEGIALRGLLVRHLVMPEDVCGTREIAEWIAREISPGTYFNCMAQYRPCHRSSEFAELRRRITEKEYRQALAWAKEYGLRLDQEVAPRGRIVPDLW
jgi:putative pyruvate formate lyase activating enzyme